LKSERATPRAADGEAPCVLVADDDAVTLRMVEHHLQASGFRTRVARDGEEAMRRLDADVAVAIFDLRMPGLDGLECLRRARERFPDLPVLIISQVGEIRDAVEAMKHGAFEFISKPIDPDELLARIRQAQRASAVAAENRQLREAVASPAVTTDLIGESEFAKRLSERIAKIAPLDSTVLITGESGTGKTTVARAIHRLGPRRSGPFVAVSCAALPRDLIEAELFGHVKGAFTGAVADRPGRAEMAHGGTLFLDEIGDLPLELQPKLLTFLQDRTVQRIGDARSRTVDVRVLAATHQDLSARCEKGQFRRDLFFRLAVLILELEPLRNRPEDVAAFAEHILARIAQKRGAPPYVLTEEARQALLAYGWPGNVRELENVLERASAFCEEQRILPKDLDLEPLSGAAESTKAPAPNLAGQTLADIERRAILETLAACGGNKRAAARSLGIDEKSIHNKMKRLGITP
jgi:DNA-binding NtrC family response regulator